MGHSGLGCLPSLWWYCVQGMLRTLFLLPNPSFCSWLFASGTWVFIFIYFWLCWVFVAAQGLLSVAASGGYSSLQCVGFPCCGAGALGRTGFSSCSSQAPECAGATVVTHGLSRSAACGIFLDQGSNTRLLHWQADSLPLSLQGSPIFWSFCVLLSMHRRAHHYF